MACTSVLCPDLRVDYCRFEVNFDVREWGAACFVLLSALVIGVFCGSRWI